MYQVRVLDVRSVLARGVTVLKLDCEEIEINIRLSMGKDDWQSVRILLVESSLADERKYHWTEKTLKSFKKVLRKLEEVDLSHVKFDDNEVFKESWWRSTHFRAGNDFVFDATPTQYRR